MGGIAICLLRVRKKITSQNWRSDLVQIWLIRESKTTGIAGYFADFASEVSAKDGLKLKCKNVKLFLREPLTQMKIKLKLRGFVPMEINTLSKRVHFIAD